MAIQVEVMGGYKRQYELAKVDGHPFIKLTAVNHIGGKWTVSAKSLKTQDPESSDQIYERNFSLFFCLSTLQGTTWTQSVAGILHSRI